MTSSPTPGHTPEELEQTAHGNCTHITAETFFAVAEVAVPKSPVGCRMGTQMQCTGVQAPRQTPQVRPKPPPQSDCGDKVSHANVLVSQCVCSYVYTSLWSLKCVTASCLKKK